MSATSNYQILVLCTGNICRSPAAEAMLVANLPWIGRDGIRSAGLAAPTGVVPHRLSVACAKVLGYEIDTSRRSRQVMKFDLEISDLILVMDRAQKRDVVRRAPNAEGKTFLVGQWTANEIPDPISKDERFFMDVTRMLEVGVVAWAAKIRETLYLA